MSDGVLSATQLMNANDRLFTPVSCHQHLLAGDRNGWSESSWQHLRVSSAHGKEKVLETRRLLSIQG